MNTAEEIESALRTVIAYIKATKSPSRSRIASALEKISAELTAPDPMTYKAFMSEYKQGVRSGGEAATQQGEGQENRWSLEATQDLVTTASNELYDLAMRLKRTSEGPGIIRINAQRMVPKMSSICSMLFYNLGKIRGLQNAGIEWSDDL